MSRKLTGSEPKDQDSPIRYAHAEAVEILNKPGRYNVLCRPAGTTCVTCLNNDNEGYSLDEAIALVLKLKGKVTHD